MNSTKLKQLVNLLFGLSFGCAVFMLLGKTYGYRSLIHGVFFITGASALILSLLQSRIEDQREEFNLIFWIGNLLVFVGLLMKTYRFEYDQYVLIPGMLITGLSYFYNPFQSDEEDDELLDNQN